MSIPHPVTRRLVLRCLASPSTSAPSRIAAAATAAPSTCRSFHNSVPLAARRRPRFKSVRADEMGLTSPEKIDEFAKENFPEYSPEEKEILKQRYTPEQIAALEAGEASINPHDLTIQGRLRVDQYRMPYIEDFSTIQPIIDRRPKNKPPPDPNATFMTEEEFTEDLMEWARKYFPEHGKGAKTLKDFVWEEYKDVPEEEWPHQARKKADKAYLAYLENSGNEINLETVTPSDVDVLDYMTKRSTLKGKTGSSGNSALAPALPNAVPGVAGLYKTVADPADEGLDDEGVYKDIKRITNLSVREVMSIKTKLIVRRHISNQTRLGKIGRMQFFYVAGNGDGWLGIGSAKSTEPSVAQLKAKMLAIKNMRPIPRYEDRTTFGNVEAKISGTVVKLSARPPGFGLRVPSRIFEMCRMAGIKDLACKIPRSRNPMNTINAAYMALLNQPNPEDIAIGRGKKMVDVRKVYYGGAVH
ncbi:ribosomal protein S5, C-terminal domain-containing protein [Coniochaeta sp. 2T2.1]|nr:ribosomal protein S5, C-terminal domain-containing protein [Coniochaeta sp. 2T2.1]